MLVIAASILSRHAVKAAMSAVELVPPGLVLNNDSPAAAHADATRAIILGLADIEQQIRDVLAIPEAMKATAKGQGRPSPGTSSRRLR